MKINKDERIAELEADYELTLHPNFDADLCCSQEICVDEYFDQVEAQLKRQHEKTLDARMYGQAMMVSYKNGLASDFLFYAQKRARCLELANV